MIDDDWFKPGNWQQGQVPTSADATTINGADDAVIDTSIATASSVSLGTSATGGKLLIRNGGTLSNGTVYMGYASSTAVATVIGTGSQWSSSANFSIGYSGLGALTISDYAATNVASIVFVGNQAGSDGALRIDSGGSLANIGAARIGSESGSTGAAIVTGAGSQWSSNGILSIGYSGLGALTISEQGVVNASNTFFVGKQAGSDGTLRIDSGGTLANFGVARIGSSSGSTGAATVTGAGSQWSSSGILTVGYGGFGVLLIDSGGRLSVNDSARIAYSAGSAGAATVTGTGSQWSVSGTLALGHAGAGVLTISDHGAVSSVSTAYIGSLAGSSGTLLIDGGGTLSNGTAYIANSAGSIGAVTVSGSGSTWSNSGLLYVGASGDGALTVADGASLANTTGSVARYAGATGAIAVTGRGSVWASSAALIVGQEGAGTLSVTDGGLVSNTGGGYLGHTTGAVGEATVTGAGSAWNTGGNLYVGHYGSGRLTISDRGTANSSNAVYVGNQEGSSGTLRIDSGGKLHGSGSAYVGSVLGSTGTATVTGSGSQWSIGADLHVGRAGIGTLTISDDGEASSAAVLIGTETGSRGTLNIGAAAGDAATAAGTLDSASLEFGEGTGTLVFNHAGATTFAAALSSSSSDSHAHDHHALGHHVGITTLTGDSSGFKGRTNVAGGQLVVGNALGGSITVGAGALLSGTGSLGSAGSTVIIAPGGVHALGSSIGTQNILGDYINHGTLRIGVTPTAADRIVAVGAVDLTDATLDLVLSSGNAESWGILNGPYTLIDKQSAGAVAGTFGQVTDNLLFLDARVAYDGGDGNDVTLEMVRNDVTFGQIGRTRNQIAAADAMDRLDDTHVLWRAVALSSDQDVARAGFDALSGEIHASTRTVLIEDSRFLRDAATDRMRSAFGNAGGSLTPVLA